MILTKSAPTWVDLEHICVRSSRCQLLKILYSSVSYYYGSFSWDFYYLIWPFYYCFLKIKRGIFLLICFKLFNHSCFAQMYCLYPSNWNPYYFFLQKVKLFYALADGIHNRDSIFWKNFWRAVELLLVYIRMLSVYTLRLHLLAHCDLP